MSMISVYTPDDDLLELAFEGTLDLTMSNEVFGIDPQFRNGLRTCIMDLTRVDLVFDSGIALLSMLSRDLRRSGATVVLLADHPDVRRRFSLIQGDANYASRQHFAAAIETSSGSPVWS
ncbi:STAS domain-containing protein [uncultured Thiodictyon sp.]|uniref:STAS domain-containing protein n=1 Tax=uncultured Thiodictyon sp. TaxID=1846217 RepID=UPI0025EB4BCB|nr:STAS domain-containing protein [uncultured Thiodictyon sp.]